MKRMLKKSLSPFILLILLLSTVVSPVGASKISTVNYIALGDSLAAGQTPYNEVDISYSDLIAMKFREENVLQSFSKEFSVPGYTTEQVLSDLKNNNVQDLIKNSNLVTISAGANDMLRLIERNNETQQITYDPSKIQPTLQSVSKNLAEIIQTIKVLSPEAEIFVMGYYFPFPHLPEELKAQLITVSQILNTTIEGTTLKEGAHFVPVFENFGTDAKDLLPNPADVHPTVEGYELMAKTFFEYYEKINQVQFVDIPQTHWAYKEISLLLASGPSLPIIKGSNFEPEKTLTRAEAAVFLASFLPVTQSVPVNPGFTDIPENHPAYYPIAKLTEVGVFSKAEKFNPEQALTRVQMAKIIALAFGVEKNNVYKASDLSPDYWGYGYIEALVSNGIMNGFSDGTFRPNNPTTRAQFAAVLARTLVVKKELP